MELRLWWFVCSLRSPWASVGPMSPILLHHATWSCSLVSYSWSNFLAMLCRSHRVLFLHPFHVTIDCLSPYFLRHRPHFAGVFFIIGRICGSISARDPDDGGSPPPGTGTGLPVYANHFSRTFVVHLVLDVVVQSLYLRFRVEVVLEYPALLLLSIQEECCSTCPRLLSRSRWCWALSVVTTGWNARSFSGSACVTDRHCCCVRSVILPRVLVCPRLSPAGATLPVGRRELHWYSVRAPTQGRPLAVGHDVHHVELIGPPSVPAASFVVIDVDLACVCAAVACMSLPVRPWSARRGDACGVCVAAAAVCCSSLFSLFLPFLVRVYSRRAARAVFQRHCPIRSM